MSLLRTPTGYRDFNVKDAQNQQARLYIGRDKTKEMRSLEKFAKCLHEVVTEKAQEANLSEDIHLIKKDYQVCTGWQPLARVTLTTEGEAVLMWCRNNPAIEQLGEADINACFQEKHRRLPGAAQPVVWCL